MEGRFSSRAWSCETLQNGLVLAANIPMDLDGLGEADLRAMELELAELQEGVQKKKSNGNCGLDAFSIKLLLLGIGVGNPIEQFPSA